MKFQSNPTEIFTHIKEENEKNKNLYVINQVNFRN